MGVGNVKMLLGRSDLNPNTPDEYGRTPLSWAAGNGHGGVVGVLLERNDVDPAIGDEYARYLSPALRGLGMRRS